MVVRDELWSLSTVIYPKGNLMGSLAEKLTVVFADAFKTAGYDRNYGVVSVSDRPDLCQFQCNGALSAAKKYRTNPKQIAQSVVECITAHKIINI